MNLGLSQAAPSPQPSPAIKLKVRKFLSVKSLPPQRTDPGCVDGGEIGIILRKESRALSNTKSPDRKVAYE